MSDQVVPPPVQPPPVINQVAPARRPIRISRVAIVVACVLAAAGVLARLVGDGMKARREQSQRVLNSLQQTTAQNDAESLAELERTGEFDPKAATERSKAALQAAANQTSGDERLFLQAMTELVEHWNQLQTPYVQQIEQASARGVFDLSAVKDLEDTKTRREAVRKLRELNDELTARVKDSSGFMRTALQAKGVRAEKTTKLVSSLAPGSAKIAPMLKIRGYEDQIWVAMDECLGILEDHPKAWSFENGQTTFSDDALLERYNGLVQRIQDLGQAQVDFQKSVLQGNPAPSPAPMRP